MKKNTLQVRKALLALSAMLMPLLASAHDFEVNGIYYNITSKEDMTVEVTYRGDSYSKFSDEYSGAVNIPSTINYNGSMYRVTSIKNHAFYRCSGLISITIPESVVSLEERAFEGCSGLTAITIPESVTSIGSYTFTSCYSLTSITIPKNITSIGESAFNTCHGLTAIVVAESNTVYDSRESCNAIIETRSNTLIVGCSTTIIPEGVTSIGNNAFFCCMFLTSIAIPEGVTSIGDYAFCSCYSLNTITIPESVTSIGNYAFDNCSDLTAINIPEGVTSIGWGAFSGCSSLTAITIPEGVTSIGGYAFCDCSSLTAITIPEGVTSIGSSAFSGCSRLTTITCNAITPPTVASSTFYGVDKSIPVYVPAGSVEAYKSAQYWSEFTNILPLTNEFTLTVSAAGYATLFLDYDVAIPDGVEVYIATSVEGDRLKMTQVTDVLPAGTGVIVRAKAGTYTITEIEGEYDAIEGNLLVGTAENTYITAAAGYNYYVLAQKDGVVGMYRPKLTNGQFLNNANKAYLALDMGNLGIFDDEVNTDDEGTQLSNRLRFDFGGTTSIQNSEFTIDNSQFIYDLRGCKVTDTEGLKGIYIVNGRKVVIK